MIKYSLDLVGKKIEVLKPTDGTFLYPDFIGAKGVIIGILLDLFIEVEFEKEILGDKKWHFYPKELTLVEEEEQ